MATQPQRVTAIHIKVNLTLSDVGTIHTIPKEGVTQSIIINAYNSMFTLIDGGSTNFSGTVSPVVNLSGAFDFYNTTVVQSSTETINLADYTTWYGGITVDALGHDYSGNVTVTGGVGSAYYKLNSGIFDTGVVGVGTIGMGLHNSYGGNPATLEFIRSVSSGQTITMANSVKGSVRANTGLVQSCASNRQAYRVRRAGEVRRGNH